MDLQKLDKMESVQDWRLKQKLRLANIICSRLGMYDEDKKAVYFLIKTVRNFNELSRTASNEIIICALCFYVLKTRNSKVNLEDYEVFEEYGLTYRIYSTISTHLTNYYQRQVLRGYVDL